MISFPTTLDGLYINGQWSSGREHLRVINPATEALLTTVNGGDEHAVDQAISAATEAFEHWSKTTGAERAAINAPFQGGAAEIIKRAMVRLPRALRDAGLKARMLLQVHDELVFEVPEAEVEATSALVRSIMESVATLRVPLSVEVGQGHSWAEAH